MKTLKILAAVSAVLLVTQTAMLFVKEFKYKQQVGSYWSLADKSSSIEKKSEYIDKFVGAIEKQNLGGHNAIFLETPDNSFEQNLEALKTLQQRLHEIKGMDVTSFQYQTAIQQITEQEQGEANEMLSVLEGVWTKENYFLLWNWVGGSIAIILLLTCLASTAIIFVESYPPLNNNLK